MRRLPLSLFSAGLLLSGCVPPPPQPYGNPYAPVYAQPQPGPAPGQPYVGPDGLTYVDGYPVDMVDGYQAQFLFLPALGGWGYYDGFHRWHGAPPGMRDRLERSHPGGRGIPPGEFRGGGRPGPGYGGGVPGRPGGFPDRQGGYQGRPGGPPGQPPAGGPPPGRPGPGGPPGRPGPGAPPPGRPPGPPPARPAPPPHNCPPGQPRC